MSQAITEGLLTTAKALSLFARELAEEQQISQVAIDDLVIKVGIDLVHEEGLRVKRDV